MQKNTVNYIHNTSLQFFLHFFTLIIFINTSPGSLRYSKWQMVAKTQGHAAKYTMNHGGFCHGHILDFHPCYTISGNIWVPDGYHILSWTLL